MLNGYQITIVRERSGERSLRRARTPFRADTRELFFVTVQPILSFREDIPRGGMFKIRNWHVERSESVFYESGPTPAWMQTSASPEKETRFLEETWFLVNYAGLGCRTACGCAACGSGGASTRCLICGTSNITTTDKPMSVPYR